MASYNAGENYVFIPDFQFLKDLPEGVSERLTVDAAGPASWKKLFGDLGHKIKVNKRYSTSLNLTYTRSWFSSIEFPQVARDAYEIIDEWTNFLSPLANFNILLGGGFGIHDRTGRKSCQ